jgi:uncharacterized protein DUF2800
MNSALQLFQEFEASTADGFPLGKQGADILDQLESVSKLCSELKEFYKAQLAKNPHCVPGWTLKPGAMRRSLGDPQRVWEKLQNVMTTEQFLCATKLEVGKLQDIWASANGIPGTGAKELFNKELGNLVTPLQSAPSLVRTKH